jgi:GNAT superfamily N-acetyltransferase
VEEVRAATATDLPRCIELLAELIDNVRHARGAQLLAALGGGDTRWTDDGPGDPEHLIALWHGGSATSAGAAATTSALFCAVIDDAVMGIAAGRIGAGERVSGDARSASGEPPSASGGGSAPAPPAGAVGRIECVYVEPGARGIGLGSALIAALSRWFADRGCSDVDALSLPGDRTTKQLLELNGFKTRLLVLHRPLSSPVDPPGTEGD